MNVRLPLSDPAVGYNQLIMYIGLPLSDLLWVLIMYGYDGPPLSDPAEGYNRVCRTTLV